MRMARVTVGLDRGVHARVATQLCECAAQYDSSVFLRTHRSASAANVFDVLALGIARGDEVTVMADGTDERLALAAVVEFLTADPHPGMQSAD
ncbi:HPr family phosphocarrier protein [Luteococcus sp. Sow4_B9]|uniref:HPr family phosphocarrier protein n=1 Tax=Luteococcus sp. Sow4_B9 TaxID=3438792 RepID=UPI003F9967B8